MPTHALLISEITIIALFAMSLDLILGYSGIVSLGHAAFFGMGAYTAALFAKHLHPDPLLGLLIAMLVTAMLGAVCSLGRVARLGPDPHHGHLGGGAHLARVGQQTRLAHRWRRWFARRDHGPGVGSV